MRHHKAFLTTITVAATVLLAGCTGSKPAARATGKPPASASPEVTLPAAPPTYTMPANLCDAVTGDSFADLVPAAIPKTSEMARSQTTRNTSSTCIISLGSLDTSIVVSVGVDIFKETYGAQGNFEGFRGTVFKEYSGAKDVTGVGTAAYFWQEPVLGPHLVVWFGNAHIGLTAKALGANKKQLPADTETRLINTAKATLAKLPTA